MTFCIGCDSAEIGEILFSVNHNRLVFAVLYEIYSLGLLSFLLSLVYLHDDVKVWSFGFMFYSLFIIHYSLCLDFFFCLFHSCSFPYAVRSILFFHHFVVSKRCNPLCDNTFDYFGLTINRC